MKQFLIAFVLSCNLTFAQVQTLVLSGDGSEIRFQSELLLKGDLDTITGTRVYRYSPIAPTLLARPFLGRQILAPYLSTDGESTGVFEYSPCVGSCMLATPRAALRINRRGKDLAFTGGGFRVSRNGRFAMDVGFPNFSQGARIFDLDSDQTWKLPNLYPLSDYSALSDTGALVSTASTIFPGIAGEPGRAVMLTELGGEPRKIYDGEVVREAVISPDSRYVFVLTESERVIEVTLPGLAIRTVWEGAEEVRSIQPDGGGGHLLIQLAQRLLLWERGSGEVRQMANGTEPIGSAVLSDDAGTVVYRPRNNALLRYSTATGLTEELYRPFVGNIRTTGGSAVPGSLVRFHGFGATTAMQISVDGVTFPLVDTDGETFKVVVPWNFNQNDPAKGSLQITQGDSPFVYRFPFATNSDYRPRLVNNYDLVQGDTGILAAMLEDFTGYVNRDRPAAAGSVIHAYMTGLGPLDHPLATLEPGPVNPLSRPLLAFACYIVDRERKLAPRGLEVLDVSYAPGLVGVYQADIRIPKEWPAGEQEISCRSSDYLRSIGRTWTGR